MYTIKFESYINLSESIKYHKKYLIKMGIKGFLGHRLLAIILLFLAIGFFFGPSLNSAKSGNLTPSGARMYFSYFLGLVSALSSAYFFKTRH